MRAEEFLEQVEKLESMIANKEARKKEWEDKATNRTSQVGSERVQSSGSKDKMASATIEVAELDKEIASLRETIKDVERVIEQTSTRSYGILYDVYFKGLSLHEVARAEGKSYTWATGYHRKAKEEVQDILDRRGLC